MCIVIYVAGSSGGQDNDRTVTVNKNLAPITSNRAACMRDAARTARQRAEETIHSFEADRLRAAAEVYAADADRLEALVESADFTAHGRAHTVKTARARIAHLEEINASHLGPSDGRVTEISTLREVLENTCLCETQSGVCGHCVNVALAEEERREAIAAHKATEAAESSALAAKYAAAEERETAERLARNIRQSRAELAGMERGTPGIGRIQYVDKKHGVTRVARYTTRDGFLRGYIRMATNPNAYGIMFVDEN